MSATPEQVRALALTAHAGQVDKQGRPYAAAHLEPIAQALAAYGEHAQMAGWLHDVIEDTRGGPDPYDGPRLLAAGVPAPVVEAVEAVTRRPGETYGDLIARAAAHRLGRVVKLEDNARNLADNAALAALNPVLARRLREQRYLPARAVLLAAQAADPHALTPHALTPMP